MVRRTVLENGIRIITERMPEVRSCAFSFMVDAGPRNESPEQAGLAHLVEHLLFEGTGSRDALQIARVIDSAGGNMGGFTTRDYTCFHATVLDDYLPYALDLFGDLLLNSVFPESAVEHQKNAILRELAMGSDVPELRANDLLKARAWPDHPLGRPIGGTSETVSRMSREDVIYFVHGNYLPDRMTIAAAGNLDHDDFVAQVRDGFWRMLGESAPREQVAPKYQGGVRVEQRAVNQAYFAFGIPAPAFADENRYAWHVLNTMLGGGMSSRLFRSVREEHGLVYSIGSEYHAYRDAGMLVIEGSTLPETLPTVLELTLREFVGLLEHDAFDPEELWKARMQLLGRHMLGAESTETRMTRLATQEFYFGRHLSTEAILSAIESVDARQLAAITEELLPEAMCRPVLTVVGPTDHDAYDESSLTDLLNRFLPCSEPIAVAM